MNKLKRREGVDEKVEMSAGSKGPPGTAFARRIVREPDSVIARREAGRRLPISRAYVLPQGDRNSF